ncbi:MAG: prepilin-type N-terminal cleavage/methylation domain-containing protein [Chitinispirillaceae bacterium]|nr:prepilin-type N-terminal cleavage/methylation domain-containing protein [Chitinispirillaceae bacterium]
MLRTNKGFTLVELMVVIVIIGVLAALAIPKFTDASTKAKISEIPTVVGSWDHGVIARISEVGTCPAGESEIVFENPNNSKWFTYSGSYSAAGPVTMTASVAADKNVGSFTNANTSGNNGAISSITAQSAITHTVGAFGDKYLGNFALTVSGS